MPWKSFPIEIHFLNAVSTLFICFVLFKKNSIPQRESKDNPPAKEVANNYKDNCFGLNSY